MTDLNLSGDGNDEGAGVDSFDAPFRELDRYLRALSRRSDGGRLGDFLGQTAQNWYKFGESGGLNTVPLETRKKSAEHFFESGRSDAQMAHDLAKAAASAMQTSKDLRRSDEIAAKQATLAEAQKRANRTESGSPAAQEELLLARLREDLKTVETVARAWTSEDQAAAEQLRDSAEKATANAVAQAARHRDIQSIRDQYARRQVAILETLNKSAIDLTQMDPLDPKYAQAKQLHKERQDYFEAQIDGHAEQAIVDRLSKLGASLDDPTAVSPLSNRMPMPKWWRVTLPSYRVFLWISLVVAVFGEVLIMNQLTGSFLTLRTLPDALDQLSVDRADGVGKIAQFKDLMEGVFSFLFSLIPLLLGIPIRDYLDRCEDRSEKPSPQFTKIFVGAVLVFLAAVGYAAYADAAHGREIGESFTTAALQVSPEQGLARALALPAITLVLLISAGWISHVLFSSRARNNYAQHLATKDAENIRKAIDSTQSRLNEIDRAVLESREAVNLARKLHMEEDAFNAAIQGLSSTTLDTVFGAAKTAAIWSLVAGYEYGLRIRQQGMTVTETTPDQRSFEETLERVEQYRLTTEGFDLKGVEFA